jgi:hypothetical protein
MRIHNKLLGHDTNSCVLKYCSGDDEEMFERNLKSQPSDWYYKDREITYSFNKNGHRCKELEDIDLNNYILFAGCSHTEGVGLELERTYPYLISQYFNCDYYNLAIAGTGIDAVEYNLISWMSLIKQKPKFVVVQWSDHSRFLGAYPNYPSLIPNGSWIADEFGKKFITSAEMSGFFYARKNLSYRLITSLIDVPIVEIMFNSLAPYGTTHVSIRKIDLARDLSHAGIKSQQKIAEDTIAYIGNKYMHERLHNPA